MTKTILSTVIASAAVALSSSAFASTITNLDLAGSSPFGGFDWSANGTAVSTPGPIYLSGDAITTTYFADAVAINKSGGGVFATPNMITSAPGGGAFGAAQYEYTVVARITETVSCGPVATPCLGSATFTATGGTFAIYYDYLTAPGGNTIANQITGTGFEDGDLLISGTINPGLAGDFTATGTSGFGIFRFTGDVTSTNSAYISPDQDFTSAIATLQFGSDTNNWTAPTATPDGALPGSFIAFQADGNQSFSVPEPGALALIGIGLLGLFGGRRARKLS